MDPPLRWSKAEIRRYKCPRSLDDDDGGGGGGGDFDVDVDVVW